MTASAFVDDPIAAVRWPLRRRSNVRVMFPNWVINAFRRYARSNSVTYSAAPSTSNGGDRSDESLASSDTLPTEVTDTGEA